MTQFGLGKYQTRCGYQAVVAQLRAENKVWILRGAIEEPTNGVLVLTTWTMGGIYQDVYHDTSEFDLVPNT